MSREPGPRLKLPTIEGDTVKLITENPAEYITGLGRP